MVFPTIHFLDSNNRTEREFTCHMRKLFFASPQPFPQSQSSVCGSKRPLSGCSYTFLCCNSHIPPDGCALKGKISLRFLTFVPYILPLTLWLKTSFPTVTALPDVSVLNSLKVDLKTKVFSLPYFNYWMWIARGDNIRSKCFLFLCRNAFNKESSLQSHVHSYFSNELYLYS